MPVQKEGFYETPVMILKVPEGYVKVTIGETIMLMWPAEAISFAQSLVRVAHAQTPDKEDGNACNGD